MLQDFDSRGCGRDELDVLKGLGVLKENKDNTYLAAFLSCWLYVLALSETEDRLIRPNTFETTSLMASSCSFSLAVPILTSIYYGLNGITKVAKPSYSLLFFSGHYLCFWTHHVIQPTPLYPLTVHYSGSDTKCNNKRDVHKLIHEGKASNLGCLTLAKNRREAIVDDVKLDEDISDYLIALQDCFLLIRCGTCFYVKPYNPHRFSR